jgi:hypothetical protein
LEKHDDGNKVDYYRKGEGKDHEIGLVVFYFVEFVLRVEEVWLLVVGLEETLLHAFY